MSRLEEEKKRHEYTLMELRLIAEDIKSDNRETLDKLCKDEIDPLKTSVTILQTSYSFIYGAIGLIGMGLLYVGYWIFGHVQETHVVAKHIAYIFKHTRWT
jgi:hypothetical protein